jgi:hypothetical protein
MNRWQTFGEPGANFVELQRQKRNIALPTVRMPKEQRTSANSVMKLSEKGYEQRSKREFGRYMEGEMSR